MASIQQTARGFRVQISVKGQRDSQVFPSKREAQVWAARRETEMRTVAAGRADQVHTLHDLFDRYADEVSVGKRGERWEQIRLGALKRMIIMPNKKLAAMTAGDLEAWRDDRLKQVSRGTVLREMNLLHNVFTVAIKWKWIAAHPMDGLERPKKPRHRERVLSWREIKAMARQLGWRRGRISSLSQSCALALFLSLRTGMRAGELCAARWEWLDGNVLRLPPEVTKAGYYRDVPLSAKTLRLIERARQIGTPTIVGVQSGTLDALFRRARKAAGLQGFTYHDSRHTATLWMVRGGKVDPLTLAKIMGWKDLKFALVYFNPSMSDVARRL